MKIFTANRCFAVLFIVIGGVVWLDTLSYSDADSYVFPRAIATAMMVFSGVLLLLDIFHFTKPPARDSQSRLSLRSLGLFGVMLGGAVLMPWVGFVLSGCGVFLVLMLLAMYERWTVRRGVFYFLGGAVIIIVFYVLFRFVLNVPLPESDWIN